MQIKTGDIESGFKKARTNLLPRARVSEPVLFRLSHSSLRWWYSALSSLRPVRFWNQKPKLKAQSKATMFENFHPVSFHCFPFHTKMLKPRFLKKKKKKGKKRKKKSFLSTDQSETSWQYFIGLTRPHSGVLAVADKLSHSYTFSTYWFWFIKLVILQAVIEDWILSKLLFSIRKMGKKSLIHSILYTTQSLCAEIIFN